MSKIKVYVRLRPPLPGEFDTPGCFNCTELEDVSGNWIRIKKEGEQIRYFARVWGPNSTQEEVFPTIGINTVNDVFEGYYGCVFVYGQTGTGKTFSLGCLTPGLEGIQPQCIRYIFEKIAKESHKYEVTVKQHYVQLYREFVQDLLDTTKDNLKIKMEESTGATIEKVTIRDINSYEEAVALIREGDNNRAVANTKMNSASSRSHACLVTEVFRKEKATGTVTLPADID
ncbi:kinesin, putative [Bodo saltans]|uniref:Kinesin, putative n=1 Tax=Bodo saltans TaxID=75058 RepID=A0A0S4J5E9_BODSA|nr:kinesin, putative [Bodo saltans]|eukprot:CUG30036.1 kinesin, putative [Bodo saltans]